MGVLEGNKRMGPTAACFWLLAVRGRTLLRYMFDHQIRTPIQSQRFDLRFACTRPWRRILYFPFLHTMATAMNTAIKLLSATTVSTGTVGAYLYYDYRTCHPMRKIKYEPKEALIRFHNSCVNQLPFLASTMSLTDLQKFDGRGNKPTYFRTAGKIYRMAYRHRKCFRSPPIDPQSYGAVQWLILFKLYLQLI